MKNNPTGYTLAEIKKPERKDKWRIIGPGGGGGQFRPTISPHDPNTVLIACDMTGAYITKDGGDTWRQFNLRGLVTAFHFDPVHPDTIYAGSNGIYRSTDGGTTWQLLFPSPDTVQEELMVGDHSSNLLISSDNWPGACRISTIQVDPRNPEHLFVSLHRPHSEYANQTVVYASFDNGGSWSEICQVEGQDTYQMHVESALSEDSLYVITSSGFFNVNLTEKTAVSLNLPESIEEIHHGTCGWNPDGKTTVFYISAQSTYIETEQRFTGVWKSKDYGQTWTAFNMLLNPDVFAGSNHLPEFSFLAACKQNAGHVYLGVNAYPESPQDCGTGSVIPFWGFMKSADEGATWQWVYKTDYNITSPNFKGGWVERDYSPSWNSIGPKGIAPLGLGVHASDPNICYATDMGASYRTLDGGESWEQVYSHDHPDGSVSSRGLDVTTCYGVHFDPFDKEHMAISYTDIGLFHSHDGGDTWHHALQGITPAWGNTCYWLVFDPDVKGRAWGAWGFAHDLPRPKMFRGGSLYRHQGGVSKTEDGLQSWSTSNQGMPENCVTTHIVLDPRSPAGSRTLYAAVFGQGVYQSTDDGRSWTLKNRRITDNLNAWRIVLLPDGTLYLLVARGLRKGKPVDGALYRSVDEGEHWEKVPVVKGMNAPNDLLFDPKDPSRMYLACWPQTIEGRESFGGVYATQDGGSTWTSVFDASKHVYGIAIDPQHPSTLFINTFDNAAYRSDDKGRTWRRLRGYNFKWGHSPFIDPHHSNRLYLTTFGSSVWYGPADGDEQAFEDTRADFGGISG